MTVATTLTTYGRASIVQRIINNTAYTTPRYLGYGSGNAVALATDETLSTPLGTRITCTVTSGTTDTPGDTLSVQGVVTYGNSQTITNIGLFDVNSLAPSGLLIAQLNPGDTTVLVNGYNNFPAFPFDVQLGSEVMTVTAGNGVDTWTVIRNTHGSPVSVTAFAIGTVIVGGNNTSNGNMFLKSSFPGITLNAGDQIQFTVDVQFV